MRLLLAIVSGVVLSAVALMPRSPVLGAGPAWAAAPAPPCPGTSAPSACLERSAPAATEPVLPSSSAAGEAIGRFPIATRTAGRDLTRVAEGKDPNAETPWGTLTIDTHWGCGDPPAVPAMRPHAGTVTIRTEAGPLCEFVVTPNPQPKHETGSLTLKASLERPALLGSGPVYVVLRYHAADRIGWARGRLSARVNGGNTFFDWLASDGSPGMIRVPVPVADILSANELKLWFELGGRAQGRGVERLVLDSVTIGDE